MTMRVGEIPIFNRINSNGLSGFSQVIDFGDTKLIDKLRQKFPTVYSCKPFKPQCEFCKEKIGLLDKDVFINKNINTKNSK